MSLDTRYIDLVRALALFVCLSVAACAQADEPKQAAGSHGPSPAPTASVATNHPTPEPLKTPERVASGAVTETGGSWSQAVRSIRYRSSADNTQQPMMFYKPPVEQPRPLLVALHSWSDGYRQPDSVIYSEWCIANDWIFIHPHFRGPNRSAETTGSELVIADVLSAIDYAKTNAPVDETRIYAVGWSGGGFLGLLLSGRAPEIWAGVSVWGPISDLNAWYEESVRLGTKYVSEIEASCGGNPTTNPAAAAECRKRSPLTHLERARAIPIDINHGIHDGHAKNDPVPVGHSLRAFNVLAAPQDRLSEEQIAHFTREAKVPPELVSEASGGSDEGLKVLFRRQSGNARLTVFDGGHIKNTAAAMKWLNQQRRSK